MVWVKRGSTQRDAGRSAPAERECRLATELPSNPNSSSLVLLKECPTLLQKRTAQKSSEFMDQMMMNGSTDVLETLRKQSCLLHCWWELQVWLHLLLPCTDGGWLLEQSRDGAAYNTAIATSQLRGGLSDCSRVLWLFKQRYHVPRTKRHLLQGCLFCYKEEHLRGLRKVNKRAWASK